MLAFSNCKINIGLRITGKRPDGFHNLETVFVPIPWYDALEITPADTLRLHTSGIYIPGPPDGNLCLKAWHLLKQDFAHLPPVAIHLHKTIPAGAGLGGGSANGACMLQLLNTQFALGLSQAQLAAYALQLGSDCPFFIYNRVALATGRGEHIVPLEAPTLAGLHLLIANPGIHVPTGWAFGQLSPAPTGQPWWQALQQQPGQWASLGVRNDFEAPVCRQWPAIADVLDTIRKAGALFTAMTGTGSTCFGLFDMPLPHPQDLFPPHYLVKTLPLDAQ